MDGKKKKEEFGGHDAPRQVRQHYTASNTISHWSGLYRGLDLGWMTPRDTRSPDSLFN